MAEQNTFDKVRKKAKLLKDLVSFYDSGEIMKGDIEQIINGVDYRRHAAEPIVVCYGLAVEDAAVEKELVVSEMDYPYVCDVLEAELVEYLRSITSHTFYYTEPSKRDGEILSVWLVFPDIKYSDARNNMLPRCVPPCWELLEVENFYDIYGMIYSEAFPEED